MSTTVEQIEKNGLAYKYVRGSTLYNTNIEGVKNICYSYIFIGSILFISIKHKIYA